MNDSIKKKVATALELIEGGDDAVRRKLIELQEKLDQKESEVAQLLTEVSTAFDTIKRDIESSISEQLTALSTEISTLAENKPKDGHTPTTEELLAIITPLLPKSPTKQEIVTVIKEVIPEPPSDEHLLALIERIIPDKEQVKKDVTGQVLSEVGATLAERDEENEKKLKDRDTALTADLINRAIGIVDGRTSFLINKVNTVNDTLTRAINQLDSTPTFETVAKNLKAYPATLNYTGSTLTSIEYDTGASTATKTLGYTGSNLTTIVLSGDIPAGIDTTKTLSYTGSNLTGVAYS